MPLVFALGAEGFMVDHNEDVSNQVVAQRP